MREMEFGRGHMKKYLDWIIAHKVKTCFIVFGLFIIPLIVIHLLYKWITPNYMLQSSWSSGELITYIAGFEAFLGTVFLGVVAVRQNDKVIEMNEKMIKQEERRDAFERQPCIMISGGKFKPDKSQGFDYILSFDFVNVSKAFAQIWILDLRASGLRGTLTPKHSDNGAINHDAPVYYFSPSEIKEITFGLDEKAFKTLSNTSCEFKLYMVNSLGEKFSEDIKFSSSVKDSSSFTISVASYNTTPLK